MKRRDFEELLVAHPADKPWGISAVKLSVGGKSKRIERWFTSDVLREHWIEAHLPVLRDVYITTPTIEKRES